MSKKTPSLKQVMVESGNVTPTSFANDPTFPSPEFVKFLQKCNYLAEVLNEDIDPLALAEQVAQQKGNLFEQYDKITEAELVAHEKLIIAESQHVSDLKEIL